MDDEPKWLYKPVWRDIPLWEIMAEAQRRTRLHMLPIRPAANLAELQALFKLEMQVYVEQYNVVCAEYRRRQATIDELKHQCGVDK